jgi:hypothetical protein
MEDRTEGFRAEIKLIEQSMPDDFFQLCCSFCNDWSRGIKNMIKTMFYKVHYGKHYVQWRTHSTEFGKESVQCSILMESSKEQVIILNRENSPLNREEIAGYLRQAFIPECDNSNLVSIATQRRILFAEKERRTFAPAVDTKPFILDVDLVFGPNKYRNCVVADANFPTVVAASSKRSLKSTTSNSQNNFDSKRPRFMDEDEAEFDDTNESAKAVQLEDKLSSSSKSFKPLSAAIITSSTAFDSPIVKIKSTSPVSSSPSTLTGGVQSIAVGSAVVHSVAVKKERMLKTMASDFEMNWSASFSRSTRDSSDDSSTELFGGVDSENEELTQPPSTVDHSSQEIVDLTSPDTDSDEETSSRRPPVVSSPVPFSSLLVRSPSRKGYDDSTAEFSAEEESADDDSSEDDSVADDFALRTLSVVSSQHAEFLYLNLTQFTNYKLLTVLCKTAKSLQGIADDLSKVPSMSAAKSTAQQRCSSEKTSLFLTETIKALSDTTSFVVGMQSRLLLANNLKDQQLDPRCPTFRSKSRRFNVDYPVYEQMAGQAAQSSSSNDSDKDYGGFTGVRIV